MNWLAFFGVAIVAAAVCLAAAGAAALAVFGAWLEDRIGLVPSIVVVFSLITLVAATTVGLLV